MGIGGNGYEKGKLCGKEREEIPGEFNENHPNHGYRRLLAWKYAIHKHNLHECVPEEVIRDIPGRLHPTGCG